MTYTLLAHFAILWSTDCWHNYAFNPEITYFCCFLVAQLNRLSFWIMTPSLFNSLAQLRNSLRKQPTFGDATTGFPTKGRQRNERRNSILMTCHYPDLGSASDWSCCMGNLIQTIRGTTQIWVVTRHQYGISALVSQTSFGGETSGSITKCQLFSQATGN